jgi:hypothetical protein
MGWPWCPPPFNIAEDSDPGRSGERPGCASYALNTDEFAAAIRCVVGSVEKIGPTGWAHATVIRTERENAPKD